MPAALLTSLALASGGDFLTRNGLSLEHYLVGQAHYAGTKSFGTGTSIGPVPTVLDGITSGTEKAADGNSPSNPTCSDTDFASAWCGMEAGPWDYVPSVGFSDIERYMDATGQVAANQFLCLTDNGFGNAANSWDYPLHLNLIELNFPFAYRHGEATFPKWNTAVSKGIMLLHDPDGHIRWENGADIQVAYKVPDGTWETPKAELGGASYKSARVLTGRDFDVEGFAMINHTYGIIGDELMPALFPIDASTGKVKGPMVRTPDIDSTTGEFNGKYLTSKGDKVHCSLADLATNECKISDDATADASEYVRHGSSGGYEGLVSMGNNLVIGFIERNGGSTLAARGEPGIRVFNIMADPLAFTSFAGFYPFEDGACCIADAYPLPGSSSKIAVAERSGFPNDKNKLSQGMPNNRICIIDLNEKNDDHTFKKMCLANYMNVADPFDVDGNGVFTYAFSQWTTEQLMIYDEHCYIAGTDTNFPAVNQFGLIPAEAPDLGQTFDTRWMMVCFHDAVFAAGAGHFPDSSPPALSDAPDCGEANSCPKGSICLAVYQQGMGPSREMLFGSSPDVPAALAHKCLAL